MEGTSEIRCIGSTSNFALKKGLKFYQTRSNAIILHETLPACCIPKVVRMETGEVIYEKVYTSPRLPPKISLKHDWMRELIGFRSCSTNRGRSCSTIQKFTNQTNQLQTQIMIELVKPVVCPQRGARGASRSQEIETRSFREEAVKHDRTVKPVVCLGKNHEQPTVVCSEQTTHPRFFCEGQNCNCR